MATWLTICVILCAAVLALIIGKIAWAIRSSPKGRRSPQSFYRRPTRRVTTATDPRDLIEDHPEFDA